MLTYFDPDLEIIVDVNDYGNGAVILIQNGKIRAVAHASRTLIAAKKNCSQIIKPLAIIFAVKRNFTKYMVGKNRLQHILPSGSTITEL